MSSWNSFVSAIKLKGGSIYGLSSETPELAAQSKEKWSLNYDLIGDPANSISEFYNVAIDRSPFALSRGKKKLSEFSENSKKIHRKISKKSLKILKFKNI